MKSNKKVILAIVLVMVSLLTFSILVSCTATVEYKVDFIVDGEVYHTINTAGETTIAMPQNPTKEGYTFMGWYNGTTKYTSGTWKTANDVTLTASWEIVTYNISYTLNGGSVSNNPTTYTVEDNITLINPTKTGYTFLGWSGTDLHGQTQNAVINTGSVGNREYVANWQATEYTITYDANGGSVSPTTQQVTYDSSYTLITPTREGYTFMGWYNGTTQYIDGIWKTANDVTLTASWEIVTYNISYTLNGGSVSNNPTTYTVEDNITLNNPTKTGYTFLGWSGTDLIGQTQNVVINIGSTGNKEYTANWQATEYTITYNYNDGVTAQTTQQVIYDTPYTLATTTKENYYFGGWYNGTTKYTNGTWKTAKDVTLTAKWMTFDEYYNPVRSNGNIVSFTYGEYPQTIKTADVTVESTASENGYYLGSDNAYYAKVIATPYKDYDGNTDLFSNGTTIKSNITYYFKVEPIKWKVLYNADGTYMVISDLILDSQCYYNSYESRSGATDYQGNSTTETVYANNYKYSDIRTFLNTTFLNSAFTTDEQIRIQTTTVDNSVSSTGYSSNSYACENTQDKIFLLSYSEATNTEYGFSSSSSSSSTRYAKGSDYAKARGLYVYTSSGYDYTGNSVWWLRSPYGNYGNNARYVYYDGRIYSSLVNYVIYGVRPALNINL